MKWAIFTFSILAVLVTTACVFASQYTNSETNSNVTTYIEDSKFPNIEIETEIGEYARYNYAIHFPKTKNDSINKTIKSFVSEQRDAFLNHAQTLKGTDEHYSELALDYEITYLSDNILSIIFRESTQFIGEDTQENSYTFNFDRQTGEKLNIEALLIDEEAKDQLAIIAKRNILQNPGVTYLTENFEQDTNNYSFFNFADSTLNITFDTNLIQQPSGEAYVVEIPYCKLNGIIKESYLSSQVQKSSNETAILSEEISNTEQKETTSTLIPGEKYVALTFDDGPHHELTPKILDILKKHNALATFYVLGNRVQCYPDIVKRAYEEGHEIGNHTWDHPQLTALSQEALLQQLNKTTNLVASITGEAPATLRPPYGAMNDTVKQLANMPLINWSVDTLDWKHKNKQKMLEIVRNTTKNGSIILMHDIQQSTADGLEDIIVELTNQGYKFVTVSTLLQLENRTTNINGQVFNSASNL